MGGTTLTREMSANGTHLLVTATMLRYTPLISTPAGPLFIFLRIIRRPAWWNLLYVICFVIVSYGVNPIFLLILTIPDFWRCYTLFGMNIDFYSRLKHFTFWNILITSISSPYKLGRIIVSGFCGFPNISFNRKAIYSTEYLGQLSKESSAKELHEMREEKIQDLLQDHQMARPLGIPLFSYDLVKDNEKDKDLSWSQLLGAISWLGIFIYYWIVDWGKPGFTDADLSKIHNPVGGEMLDVIQPEKNNTEYIQFSDEISMSGDSCNNLDAGALRVLDELQTIETNNDITTSYVSMEKVAENIHPYDDDDEDDDDDSMSVANTKTGKRNTRTVAKMDESDDDDEEEVVAPVKSTRKCNQAVLKKKKKDGRRAGTSKEKYEFDEHFKG